MVLSCPDCDGERTFDQPPCVDGHGADCPEWACTDCGFAMLVGPFPLGSEPSAAGTFVPAAA